MKPQKVSPLTSAVLAWAVLRGLTDAVVGKESPERRERRSPARLAFSPRDSSVRWLTLRIMRVVAYITVGTVLISRAMTASRRKWDEIAGVLQEPPAQIDATVRGFFAAREAWPAEAWVAFLLPCIGLPLLAFVFHYLDYIRGGGGIKDRIALLRRPHSELQPEVVAATMTKQSILAAIAAIFLARSEQGSLTSVSFWEFAIGLSRLGFAGALLLLTVSALAYDYANRFKFRQEEKYDLVLKGLKLDVLSWYVLIASFIVGMAANNVRMSILVSIGTGFLVWWYYFLDPRPFGGPRRRTFRTEPQTPGASAFRSVTRRRTDERRTPAT